MQLQWGIPDTTIGLQVSSAARIAAFDSLTVPHNWIERAKRPDVVSAVLGVLDEYGGAMDEDVASIPMVSWRLVEDRLAA